MPAWWRWRRSTEESASRGDEDQLDRLIDSGDLVSLAELLNRECGAEVVTVDDGGIRLVDGVTTDVEQFRRLAPEDPGAALALVRGVPLGNIESDWAVPFRAELQAEIVAAAHSACRLDPDNATDYLRQGLTGAPGDPSLWIALLGVAGRSGSVEALELGYKMAGETYETGTPSTVPLEVQREYLGWRERLGAL